MDGCVCVCMPPFLDRYFLYKVGGDFVPDRTSVDLYKIWMYQFLVTYLYLSYSRRLLGSFSYHLPEKTKSQLGVLFPLPSVPFVISSDVVLKLSSFLLLITPFLKSLFFWHMTKTPRPADFISPLNRFWNDKIGNILHL